MITSEIITDSIGPNSPRLTTMLCKYPKFIHGEHLRHRSFSFSVSSSRAIPVSKNLEEVRSDELRAQPVWWGREQKGMASGDELGEYDIDYPEPLINPGGEIIPAKEAARLIWNRAAKNAIDRAKELQTLGAHKSIVNRILEPFLHVNVLVTGTHDGWMNFFGLRLDSYAQPEIRTLAEAQWRCWNEHEPRLLQPGEWHLPFADDEETILNVINSYPSSKFDELSDLIKVSVARCARLSYLSFETNKRSTIEEDLALYQRLVGSTPIHASPAEHQATPDKFSKGITPTSNYPIHWHNPHLSGNLGPGYIQYRKTLPGEAIAPLPKEYTE